MQRVDLPPDIQNISKHPARKNSFAGDDLQIKNWPF